MFRFRSDDSSAEAASRPSQYTRTYIPCSKRVHPLSRTPNGQSDKHLLTLTHRRPFARGNQKLNTSTSKNLAQSPTASPSSVIENPLGQSSAMSNNKTPMFFREQYANLIVKGNFMTLAAKPVLIEEGEWLAHQGMLTVKCFATAV